MRMLSRVARRLPALALVTLALAGCAQMAAQPTSAPATTQPAPQPTVAPAPTQPAPAADTPRRISFAAGASSADVSGAVVRGDRDYYLFWAEAGQQATIALKSTEENGELLITPPDGAALPAPPPGADAGFWSGALPATGDYLVEVGPTRGNLTYTLSLSIVSPAPAGSIRDTDWAAHFAADPAFDRETLPDGRLYLTLRGVEPQVGGIPLVDDVVYGDFDGDGRDEAAVTLNSGGTAGNVGLLVYRQGGAGPELAAWRDGYKLWASAEGGQLLVREPIYAGWEPNCCPTGLSTLRSTLGPGGLETVEQRSEGVPEAQPGVVEHFYDLIRAGSLRDAYALLSDAEQAANPYDAWAAGFANTVGLEVNAVPGPKLPNTVWVTIKATDRAADGSQVTHTYTGTWELAWVPGRPGYALTNPQIQLGE